MNFQHGWHSLPVFQVSAPFGVKSIVLASFAAAIAPLVVSLSWLPSAHGAFVNFNTVGDLDGNFNHTATLPFAEADSVGVENPASRGLTVTGTTDSYATFKTSSMQFGSPGTQVSVSAFFHTAGTLGTTGEDRVLELNVAATETSVLTAAHTGIGGKIEFNNVDGVDDIQIRFRRDNADVAGSLNATLFDIKTNTWYKATFSATNMGTASTIPSTMVIDEYNSDGTALVSANVYNHSFAIPIEAALTADGAVYGGFRVRNGTRLYNAIDNFEQLQLAIPEPTSLVLGGLVAMGLLAVRRRASIR